MTKRNSTPTEDMEVVDKVKFVPLRVDITSEDLETSFGKGYVSICSVSTHRGRTTY